MKYNRGFTLAELLIVLGIMGILMTAAIVTFKPFDKGIKYLHSNTYYVLNRAYYNVMNDYRYDKMRERDPFQVQDADLGTQNLTHSIDEDGGTQKLCEGLTHFINVVSDNCNEKPVSADIIQSGDFSEEKITPHFIAVNGIRFFISHRLGTNTTVAGGKKGVYFYLIFADMNGTKPPNSGIYTPADKSRANSVTRDPDVFVFAAFEGYDGGDSMGLSSDAQLIPVGIAEFDQRYMQTRIIYTDDDEDAFIKYSKNSQPYYISKCEAWGYYNPNNNNNSNNMKLADNNPSNIEFLINEPHTFSDYVRGQLSADSNYKDSFILSNITRWANAYKDLHEISNFSPTGNSCSKSVETNLRCHAGSDACSIVIDKYVY